MTSVVARLGLASLVVWAVTSGAARGQDPDPLVVRPAPPALEDFETDANRDGVPDGWYNLRDGKVVAEGGTVGPRFLRLECARPGRPARLSRAFGIDGRRHEAIVLSLWIRAEQIQTGERLGEEPGLIIDFLGADLRHLTRGALGPWNARTLAHHTGWTRVSKRVPVPSGALDAIMSVGLLGATGVLDVDGMTIELVPVGGSSTDNLIRNPGFELGDPEPNGWASENGARRTSPGYRSNAALELGKAGARSMTGLALPVERLGALAVSVQASARGLRGGGGAMGLFFFLDDNGRVLPGLGSGVRAFLWSGSFDWQEQRTVVPVPQGAVRAVFQVDKPDGLGSLRLDDLKVAASPDPSIGTWTPYHVDDEIASWLEVAPSPKVEAGSALDFSFLHEAPAGQYGAVVAKDGRLHFSRSGERARFFGVQLLPPTAFLEAEAADALADRLARSGVNLVRLGELDTPLGPDRSLFDDTRDDTAQFDPIALARLDHLIAALKARGIHVAIELLSARRFRSEDGVATPGALPPGGGPAAVFDPVLVKHALTAARALLTHVNPETQLALKDDPALAWVTLAGEVSLFDLIDHPSALPGDYAKAYRALAAKSTTGIGRRFWQALESAHAKEQVDALRKLGLKAPVAGVSHWRREPEFSDAQAATGLDLIDDRIFWAAPSWIAPRFRSMLWSLDGGLIADSARKRRADRPYVLGQWCDYSQGVWATAFEAAEQLLAARIARAEDWDGLVRRGVFIHPLAWGAAATGTGGGEDIFQLPEVANAAPHVFALWPHAASITLRGEDGSREKGRAELTRRSTSRTRKQAVPGWEPERGRLVVDTPHTEGVAGWPGGESVSLEQMTFDVENTYAVVVASAVGNVPLAKAKRVLVTAIGRVEPTGFRWVDEWRREAADPGRPPLRQEPVLARVLWKRPGTIQAFALDNTGARIGPAKLEKAPDGARLVIDGTVPVLHWELVAE